MIYIWVNFMMDLKDNERVQLTWIDPFLEIKRADP
jgi:hypothetical protein